MTPNFALVLSFDQIRLMQRHEGGWGLRSMARMSSDDFDAVMARLHASALETGLELTASVILPDEQVKYLSLPGTAPEAEVLEVLEGATPYDVSDLVVDYAHTGKATRIAAVAKETLAEAEEVLTSAGFVPVSFGAIAPPERFPREVWFGPSIAAAASGDAPDAPDSPFSEKPLPPDPVAVFATRSEAEVDDLSAPRRMTLADDVFGADSGIAAARAGGLVDPAPEGSADPAPTDPAPTPPPSAVEKAEPKPRPMEEKLAVAVGKAKTPVKQDATTAPAESKAPAKASTAAAPTKTAPTTVPKAKRQPLPAAGAKPGSPAKTTRSVTLEELTPTNAAGESPDAEMPARIAASLNAQRDVGDITPPHAVATPEKRPVWPLAAGLVVLLGGLGALWMTSRNAPEELIDDTPVVAATDTVQPGQPSVTGLDTSTSGIPRTTLDVPPLDVPELSVSELRQPTGSAGLPQIGSDPEPSASAPTETTEPEPVVDPDPQSETPVTVPAGLGDILSLDEARRVYAATGVWLRSPALGAAPLTEFGFARPAAQTGFAPGPRSSALASATALSTDQTPGPVQPPIGRDQFIVLDSRGVVPATPEGVRTPEGFIAFLGRPPVQPRLRPLPIPPMADIPEGFRPSMRPLVAEPTPAAEPEQAPTTPEPVPSIAPPPVSPNAEEDQSNNLIAPARPPVAAPPPRSASLVALFEATEPEAPAATPDVSGPVNGALSLAMLEAERPPARPEGLAPPPIQAAVPEALVPRSRPRGFTAEIASRPAVPVATSQVARPSGPVNATVTRRATQENVLNLRRMNLIAVSGKSNARSAIVRAPTGAIQRVRVGDRLDGGRVRAIDSTSLRYVKGGRTITLQMPRG